jgi:hypothetical protein
LAHNPHAYPHPLRGLAWTWVDVFQWQHGIGWQQRPPERRLPYRPRCAHRGSAACIFASRDSDRLGRSTSKKAVQASRSGAPPGCDFRPFRTPPRGQAPFLVQVPPGVPTSYSAQTSSFCPTPCGNFVLWQRRIGLRLAWAARRNRIPPGTRAPLVAGHQTTAVSPAVSLETGTP